jgi:hypothetical protein
METTGSGILGRISEKMLTWIGLALLVFLAIAIWRMPAETRAAIWSGIWRSGAWVVIAAAVPWSGKLCIGRILETGTNWAGAGLLAALLAVDLIAAALLMTGWPSSLWSWLAAIGALALAVTYNYLVTEYLSETAGG